MKLARYTVDGRTTIGAIRGDQVVDIDRLDPAAPRTIRELLALGVAARQRIADPGATAPAAIRSLRSARDADSWRPATGELPRSRGGAQGWRNRALRSGCGQAGGCMTGLRADLLPGGGEDGRRAGSGVRSASAAARHVRTPSAAVAFPSPTARPLVRQPSPAARWQELRSYGPIGP
jgi:hypothetical protein